MNAGHDHRRALEWARANATRTQTPRWLTLYNGCWWIDQEPTRGAERVDPTPVAHVANRRDSKGGPS